MPKLFTQTLFFLLKLLDSVPNAFVYPRVNKAKKKFNFHYEKTMETHVRIFPFSQQRGAWVAKPDMQVERGASN